MNKKIRILHLEDSVSDSELIHSLIKSGGIEHDYLLADNEKDFLKILVTENIDLILSDYNLPDYNGLEALKVVKEKYSHMPFILVSGTIGEDAAINSLLNGATDYVLKNKLMRLLPAIKRAIHEAEIEQAKIQAENELRESEKKYRQLAESSPEMIYVIDANGYVSYVNRKAAEQFHLPPEEIIGKHLKDIFPLDIAQKNFEGIKHVIETKSFSQQEVLQKFPTGNLWVDARLSPIFDEKNQVTGVLGLSFDITERRRAEEKLHLADTIISNMEEGVYLVKTSDGTIVYTNSKFDQMFGHSKGELIGKHVSIVNAPTEENPIQIAEEIIASLNKDKIWNGEVLNIKKDGTTFWCSAHVSTFEHENYGTVWISVHNDITERKRIEEEILLQRNKFSQLYDNSPIAIAFLDDQDRIVTINESFSNMFGYFLEEIKGKFITDLIVPPELKDEDIYYFSQILEGFHVNKDSYRRRKDRTTVNVQIIGVPVIENDRVIGVYGMYVDLTQKKKAEQELIIANKELAIQNEEKEKRAAELVVANKELAIQNEEKEKRAAELVVANKELLFQNEEKEKRAAELIVAKEKAEEMNKVKNCFLSNMSHELRTPMISVLGFAELLQQELKNPTHVEFVNNIIEGGQRLNKTLNEILEISKLEAEKSFNRLRPHKLADEIASKEKTFLPMAQSKRLFLKTEFNNTNLHANIDQELYGKALFHLVHNALKYTKEGGVCVSLHHEKRKDQDWAVTKVIDTGVGIPKEDFEKIFNAFRQSSEGHGRSHEGVGLGLTITKKVVELMKGKVEVESEVGKGSVFSIWLPAILDENQIKTQVEELRRTTVIEPPTIKERGLKKVLVVDDNSSNRLFMNHCLSSYVRIIEAGDGISGVTFASKEHFDLILMDINLGAGIDGVEAMHQIRKIPDYARVPIIAITAYVMFGDKERFLNEGFDNYLAKPFMKVVLVNLVENTLAKVKK